MADLNIPTFEINGYNNISHNQTTSAVVSNETIIETILTCIICITGLLGNVAIASVILRYRRMQTPVNWFVFNLSVCGLAIVLIIIPYDLVDEVIDFPFREIGCKYLFMPVMEHFAAVCILTHTALGAARYIAIRKCGKMHKTVSNRNVRGVICLIWIVSFLVLSTPLMGLLGKFSLHNIGGKLKCTLQWISVERQRTYRVCVFVLTYVIPTTITGFSYYQIHKVVKKNIESVDGHLPPDVVTSRRRKGQRMNAVFRNMFLSITMTTFPLQSFMFCFDFKMVPIYRGIRVTFNIFMILYYTQVVINPFVLFYMSEEYRKQVCCCLSLPGRNNSTQTISFSREVRFESSEGVSNHNDVRNARLDRYNQSGHL